MNRSDQDRLLREIVSGEELTAFRLASLHGGLRQLRRLRRRRRAFRVSALLLLPFFALAVTRHFPWSSGSSGGLGPRPVVAQVPPVEFINDEQLLALFPQRPVALIGAPGHQQLVFLDLIPDSGGLEPNDTSASAIQ